VGGIVVLGELDAAADATPRLKAADLVARDLCRKIVEGDLREGDALPAEPDLMARYGVSRAVLREAMRLLEWDSFVTIRRGAGGGPRVTLPDARVPARYCGLLLQVNGTTLEDVDAALTAVEPEVVALIAASPTRTTAVLEHALVAEELVIDRFPAFVLAGSHFHELLPLALGNPALAWLLGIVREIRERHNIAALAGTPDQGADGAGYGRTHATHREVLAVIERGEAEQARDLWVRHLHATSRVLAKAAAKTVLDLFNDNASEFDWASAPRGARRMTRLPKGADIVAGELRRRIIGGEMGEGQFVPTETALMAQFGLSRPSVREALRVLEAEHLVQPIRGSHHGGRVCLPTVTTAAWHTGLLLERSGATVGQLLEAQLVLDRCLSATVVESDVPRLVPELERAVEAPGANPGDPWGGVMATLAVHASVSRLSTCFTLRCVGDIGRALVRQSLSARGPDAARTGWDDRRFARRRSQMLRMARRGELGELAEIWRIDSEECYKRLRALVDPRAVVDMFS
jgi:DNA-binding FadR family transcriptional regulator